MKRLTLDGNIITTETHVNTPQKGWIYGIDYNAELVFVRDSSGARWVLSEELGNLGDLKFVIIK